MKTLPRITPVFFTVLALVISQLACSIGGQAPAANPQSGTPSGSSPTSAPALSLSGDPISILTHAFQILPSLSYRVKQWYADQGKLPDTTQPPSLTAEFTPPNNVHGTGLGSEYISVNGNFYTRDAGGTWQSAPAAAGASAQSMSAQITDIFVKALQNGGVTAQSAGNDSVNGVAAQVFTISGQFDMGTVVSISGKVWVGGDGRLLKIELSHSDTQQVFDIALYEYDPSISITAPIP